MTSPANPEQLASTRGAIDPLTIDGSMGHRAYTPLPVTVRCLSSPSQAVIEPADGWPWAKSRQMRDLLGVVFGHCGSAVMVVKADPQQVLDGAIVYVNAAFCRLAGFEPQEIEGKPARGVVQVESSTGDAGLRVLSIAETQLVADAWVIQDAAEEAGYVVFQQQAGSVRISPPEERDEALARLQATLSAKDALLRETHHRVKNNLQIVSSLLRLQAASTPDPYSIACLEESRNRVETIALLHDHLHQTQNPSHIDASIYLQRLVTTLMTMHAAQPNVEVSFDAKALILDSHTTVLCGLILNELVSNSMRHAFPDGRGGKIAVRLLLDGGQAVSLIISDDGIGLPGNFDLDQAGTLGLRLVRRLTRQIHGTVSTSNADGLEVTIQFPHPDTLHPRTQESG